MRGTSTSALGLTEHCLKSGNELGLSVRNELVMPSIGGKMG